MTTGKKQHWIESLKQAGLLVALTAGTFLSGIGHAWAWQEAGGEASALTRIEISFKVDSRLTRGLYMGDRWGSVPIYTGTVGQDRVDARAHGVDGKGAVVAIGPQWIPSDPEMLAVSPSEGNEVKITVKRAGESRLKVTFQELSKELAVKAAYRGAAIQVEIAQLGTKEQPAGAATLETPMFKSPKEKLSYALGMSLVSQLRSQRVELDADHYVRGFRDALSGSRTLLTEAEARAAIDEVHSGMKKTQVPLQPEKLKELAERNQREGEMFLAANKGKPGVVTLESGIQYKVLKEGDGPRPGLDGIVVCHYRGVLIDGTEFDSSYKRIEPATLALNKVIKGWSEALQLMPVGSKWQLFIPPSLAYGARGAGGKIGPNVTLIFEVELISIEAERNK